MDELFLKNKHKKLIFYTIGIILILAFMEFSFGMTSAFAVNSILLIFVLQITIVDIKEYIVPDESIIAMLLLGLIIFPVNPYVSFVTAVIGFFGLGGIMFLLSKVSEGQIGMGDAKLIAVLGLWLGIKSCFMVFLYALILGGIYGLVLMAVRHINRKTEIPFVPFVLAGIVIEMFMKF